jgi:hypothetical protein
MTPTDLEQRLEGLAAQLRPPTTPPSGAELRTAAGRRRRRHRARAAAATLLPLAVVVILLVVNATGTESGQEIVTDAPPATEDAAPVTASPDQRSLGDVEGVTLEVTPRVGLRDGDIVEVRIDGLDRLPGARLVMCAGDVDETSVMVRCDLNAVQLSEGSEPSQVVAASSQLVPVQRFLSISSTADPNQLTRYDCANEPAGCLLGVGPLSLPARGVAVPIEFADHEVGTPVVTVSASTGLVDGQEVSVEAEGLRPNLLYSVRVCHLEAECDLFEQSSAVSDSEGRLETSIRVWANLYHHQGLFDCRSGGCGVRVADAAFLPIVEVPVAFAPGVLASEPRMWIEEPGPYTDRQEVTVRGENFRPGLAVGGRLAQCPNDKDTSLEERCGYWLQPDTVDSDGSFTTTTTLTESLLWTGSCIDGPGCHLGWVIPNGVTLAKVPLEFRR